jgi:hypothetical protein
MFAWIINFFRKLFGFATTAESAVIEPQPKPEAGVVDQPEADVAEEVVVDGETIIIPIFKPLPEGSPYPRQAGPDVYWIERGVSDVTASPWNSSEINQHATVDERLHNLKTYEGGFRQNEETVRLQMAARIVELEREGHVVI